MINPSTDARYLTADGCTALAQEMEKLARSAQLLANRHAGWARALRTRAERLEKADMLELEAKAERDWADRAAMPQYMESDCMTFDRGIEDLVSFLLSQPSLATRSVRGVRIVARARKGEGR